MKQLCIVLFLLSFSGQAQTTHNLHLIKRTVLGGEGGWDYLTADAEGGRLYVSHGSQVEVLDINSHKQIGKIAPTPGVHGIVLVPHTKIGYITVGRSNNIAMFDVDSMKIRKEIPSGVKPDAILYDQYSDRVFVFNNGGASATVLDAKSGNIAGTIALGGAPEAGVSDGKGRVYVNLEDKNEVVALNSKTLAVLHRWPLTGGEEPTGLAIDIKRGRLFAACHNEVMVILDTKTGAVLDTKPIGGRVDGAVFNNEAGVAITSNGIGTLTLIKESGKGKFDVVETVLTALGARTIAIDPVNGHVFVTTAEFEPKPEPTSENPNPRAPAKPGTFMILEYGY